MQIVANILSVVGDNDAKKTRIMYLANLSWDLLTRYLNDLMEAGLVNLGSSDRYVLTPKGKRFIDRFSEYCKRREKVEKLVLENTCLNAKEEADEK